VIGTLDFVESISNNSIHFILNSEVKTRFVFTFTVKAKEESIYKNGILIYSSVYRNFNGKVKINKQTRLDGGVYHISNKGDTSLLKIDPIHYNFHGLYFFEPKQLSIVYSDNYSKYMPIIKMSDNKYKVNLPDGNYNYYYYKDGICEKVEMFTSFYTAQMVLKK
jgi:regulation of enolase protein 1 (concanavalin A-like superfamily)